MALHEVKICLLGESGVGKTCIVNRFVSDIFSEHETLTVGAAFSSRSVKVGENSIVFQIWDTAGQEKYRGLAPMYYRGSGAAIVVYDITSEQSFREMQSWITELKQLGPPDIVLAVAGNKVDIEVARQARLYPTRQNGTNVEELFRTIANSIPLDHVGGVQRNLGALKLGRSQVHKKSCCK
ncbi:hypothetical protein EMCRGX_G030974 [Ephydatia muelleri]